MINYQPKPGTTWPELLLEVFHDANKCCYASAVAWSKRMWGDDADIIDVGICARIATQEIVHKSKQFDKLINLKAEFDSRAGGVWDESDQDLFLGLVFDVIKDASP